MRTILFRGKRVDNGEWVYGYYYTQIITHAGNKKSRDHFMRTEQNIRYEVDPETVGQYTGLTDKNGKMIFEGDVAKAEHDNYYNPEHEEEPEYSAWIGSIEYEEGYYQINTNCEYRPAINNIRIKTIEVIGNIHDNPELLGGDNT